MWNRMLRLGADVEVELQDTGGRPDIDLYEASVIKRHQSDEFVSVLYKGICRDDDSSLLLTEKVSTKFVRPCPPATPNGFEELLNVGCQVDVYDDEVCSWGIVTVRQIHRHANTGITDVWVEHHDVLAHKSGAHKLGPPNGVLQLVKTSSLRPRWDARGGKWVNMTCLRASFNPLSTAPGPTNVPFDEEVLNDEEPLAPEAPAVAEFPVAPLPLTRRSLAQNAFDEQADLNPGQLTLPIVSKDTEPAFFAPAEEESSVEEVVLASSERRTLLVDHTSSELETRAQHLLARAAEKNHMVNMIMEEARQTCVELKNGAEAARMKAFSMLDAHGERVKQDLRAEDRRTTEALKKLHRHQISTKRARLEDERKTAALEAEVDALRAKALRTSTKQRQW